MNQKLDIGGTLSQIFSTYGAQAGVLLPVAFGLYVVVAIVNGIIAGSFFLFPLGLAVSVVAATLYQGWSSAWSRTSRMAAVIPRLAI